MKRGNGALLAATIVAALAVGGCTVPKDTADTTPPSMVIKVKNADGQYVPAATASLAVSDGRLDLMCIVSDPQGVSAIQMTVLGESSGCTLNGGGIVTGSFPILGLPPATPGQNLTGNAQGKVLTELPLLATLKGPLSCKVLGNPTQTGVPIGATVNVTCTGQNWSSNPNASGVQKTLNVSLQ